MGTVHPDLPQSPDIFKTQLRGAAARTMYGQYRLLCMPMITSVEEVKTGSCDRKRKCRRN